MISCYCLSGACYLLGALALVALYRHAVTDVRGWLLGVASAVGAVAGLVVLVARI